MNGKRIAVIGGGVSGLSAAWLLSGRHHVTLFEGNDYVGGHTHTQEVGPADNPLPVDTGFIVYNEPNYPLLTGMLSHLGVTTCDSDMSFAFRSADGRLEWAGDSMNKLFAQRRNLFNPSFLRMVGGIMRFNHKATAFLRDHGTGDPSLGEYLDSIGAPREVREHYLLPMAAAIWSCPQQEMLQFPARRFLQFFRNHGLLDLVNRPQWRTVRGGGREYVRRMLPGLSGGHQTSTPVKRVVRREDGVELFSESELLGRFDEIVLATHADQALSMLTQPHYWESRVLGAFRYQRNEAWLHSDPSMMPGLRKIWASWNYQGGYQGNAASVTYWMNRLQDLPGETDYFVTLNPETAPKPALTHKHMVYDHPVFDAGAVRAQSILKHIQGRDRIWFCGSYTGYGFHEDGLRSAVEVARAFDITPPWQQPETAIATATPVSYPAPEWQHP